MISLSSQLDASFWGASLAGLPRICQDVYFAPEYAAIHEVNGDGEAYCSLVSDGAEQLLIPGLRISIPASSEKGLAQWDIQTCNGYGGPLASAQASEKFLEEAWAAWRQASSNAGIVAAFFRLHPLLGNDRWLPKDAAINLDRQTVCVDLAGGVEATWGRADSRHRNMVNKGRREGLSVQWDDPSGWADFELLYQESMERLNAPAALRFSPAYFQGLSQMPGVSLASVRNGTQLSAAAVFMFGAVWGHYHLSARREGSGNHLTSCLLQAGIERAVAAGMEDLHLGGGRSRLPDDGLLKFKLSVGGKLLDFKVALVIADTTAYEKLCTAWATETGSRPEWLLGYRQPKRNLVTG